MKRIAQLDGVRGVAIIMVVIFHYFARQLDVEPGTSLSYAKACFLLGWSGVDLFFVLSGFLITGILLDHHNTSNFFRIFYLRRTCRIFPLYFLLLGSFVFIRTTPIYGDPAFEWLFHNPLPLWSYATFTQNLIMGIHDTFGPDWLAVTWSLAVEEQFYLVIPLVVYFLPKRILPFFLIAGIFSALFLRWAWPGFHSYLYTPWHSDPLFSGALLAVLVRWHPFVSSLRRRRRTLLVLFGAFMAGAAILTWRPSSFGIFKHFWLSGLYSVFVLMAFMGNIPGLSKFLESPILAWFGKLSFGIYMMHEAVNGMLHGIFMKNSPEIQTLSDVGITVMALVATLGLAVLSHRFLESPFLRLGHRFTYLPKPAP